MPAAAALTTTGALVAQGQTSAPPGAPPAPANAPASGPYAPNFFHPAEWTFINAAVARLIPSDNEGPGGIEAGVPEFIDRQMDAAFGTASLWYMQGPFVESPPEFGYQGQMLPRDVYRAGILAVDTKCKADFGGKTFAQLAISDQEKVLKGLESGDFKLEGVSGKTFFGFLLQNTKEGYLSDPMHGGNKDAGAWKMIGFPGARADYADWIGRPVKYPLPPVTIRGPQGG